MHTVGQKSYTRRSGDHSQSCLDIRRFAVYHFEADQNGVVTHCHILVRAAKTARTIRALEEDHGVDALIHVQTEKLRYT
jgi:hypothetical protein